MVMTHQMVHAYITNDFKNLAKMEVLLVLVLFVESCGIGQNVQSNSSFINDEDVNLEIISGNDQFGIINQQLELPLVVKAYDENAEPAANERIEFSVIQGSAQVTPYDNTNQNGQAQATVTIGQNPEHIQIRAYWPAAQREVVFDLFGSLALLNIQAGPGLNNMPSCVGENETYASPVIIELVGENNIPVANTVVEINIANGTLDQNQFEESINYTTASNGKIVFDVIAGTVDQDEYSKNVQIVATVPSMNNVPPLVLIFEVTKPLYLEAISDFEQFSDLPTEQNVGIVNWDFDFKVKVYGVCEEVLNNQAVQFERRWSVSFDFPCAYQSDGEFIENWNILGSTFTDSEGIATYTKNLRVKHPFANYFFPQNNQIKATIPSIQNINSHVFEAKHGLCEN